MRKLGSTDLALSIPPKTNEGILSDRDLDTPKTNMKSESITEKFLARRFLSIQQALEEKELDNAYWIPGKENRADGLTKLRSEISPLLRLLESGAYTPGMLRPLRGISLNEA